MSRMSVDCNDSRVKHDKHLRKVSEKLDVLYRKELLLSVWEEIDAKEYNPEVHQYVLGLRSRVRAIRNQLMNMNPIKDEDGIS